MKHSKSQKLFKQGSKHLVGAVNSPVRAFASVGGNPLFIKKAKGSKIYDVDGNKYVDFVGSYGPMILGHRHKKVQKSIQKALKNGYTFGASTKNEIKLGLNLDYLPRLIVELERASNRLAFSLIIAGLIVGSSILTFSDSGPKYFSIPILGLIGYVLAGILGLGLIVSMIRSNKL